MPQAAQEVFLGFRAAEENGQARSVDLKSLIRSRRGIVPRMKNGRPKRPVKPRITGLTCRQVLAAGFRGAEACVLTRRSGMHSDISRMRTALEHSRSVLIREGGRRRPRRSGRYGAFRSAQGYGPEQSEAQRDDSAEAYKDTHGQRRHDVVLSPLRIAYLERSSKSEQVCVAHAPPLSGIRRRRRNRGTTQGPG